MVSVILLSCTICAEVKGGPQRAAAMRRAAYFMGVVADEVDA